MACEQCRKVDGLMSVNAACEFLDISRTTIYQLMSDGEFPWVLVGAHRRIRIADIQAYIERQTRGGGEVAAA